MSELSYEPAKTPDGTVVKVMANIGNREDVLVAAENGADGIGLYCMEHAYRSCKSPPLEYQLIQSMCVTFSLFEGLPITVCLWDGVGEGQISVVNPPDEASVAAGSRGIRLLMRRSGFIRAQLRILLQLAQEHNIRILVPFIALPEDVEWTRGTLQAVAVEAEAARLPSLGAMVEPRSAAALVASDFAACINFLSIDKGNQTPSEKAEEPKTRQASDRPVCDTSTALQIVRAAVIEGRRPLVQVELCEGLAMYEEIVPALIDRGVREFSVPPQLIAAIKGIVRDTSCNVRNG